MQYTKDQFEINYCFGLITFIHAINPKRKEKIAFSFLLKSAKIAVRTQWCDGAHCVDALRVTRRVWRKKRVCGRLLFLPQMRTKWLTCGRSELELYCILTRLTKPPWILWVSWEQTTSFPLKKEKQMFKYTLGTKYAINNTFWQQNIYLILKRIIL